MLLTGQDTGVSSEYKRDIMPPTRQVIMTSGRHNSCDKQPDCIAVTDELSTTSGSIQSPRHHIMRSRSG